MSLFASVFNLPFVKESALYISSRTTHRRRGPSDTLARLLRYAKLPGSVPWARNLVPLADSKIAIVTTAGYYAKGQPAFLENSPAGDWTFRVIPRDMTLSKLILSNHTVDRRPALLDPNLLLPLDRLNDLKTQGVIGSIAANHYSFYSFTTRPNRVVDGSAKDAARRIRYEGVDKVVILTASIQSQEIAFLVQRAIEDEGIPTVSLAYTQEAVESLRPPRACILTKGSLFRQSQYLEPDVQMNLLRFMLAQFDEMTEPGSLKKVVFTLPSGERPRITPPAGPFRARPEGSQKDLFE
jgi:D-proline reductase (dithiol) PrdB